MKKDTAKAVADVIRTASGTKKYKPTSAVILAAGSSTRMNGENKQFIAVGGLTVLARTILAFEAAECIDEIVVVTKKELIGEVIDLCEKYSAKKVTAVVPGGENREESAWLGFSEISDRSDFVAIHDGARCLVTPEMIEKVCVAAYNYGAAAAAHRSTDSVKVSGKRDFIDETLDRDCVWLVQTPQVFGANLYRAAAYTAREAKFEATDDCALVERLGYKTIKLVECGTKNMKITTPEDIAFANAIAAQEEKI